MELKKNHSSLYAIIRFVALLFSYLMIVFTYDDFKSMCMSMLIFMITIMSDYLILLFTSEKDKIQYNITLVMFSISSIIVLSLFLGVIGIVTLDVNNILYIRNISNGKDIISVKNFNITHIFTTVFLVICGYIFEYTGLLKREPVNKLESAHN